MMVLFCHLYTHTPFLQTFKEVVPHWLERVFISGGSNGVTIFFVISGFVIAYSLRDVPMNRSNILRFALRRQIRLDPVYWVAIVVSLSMLLLEQIVGEHADPMFSPLEVLINGLYLHEITGTREILSVAWTLCIEIQFYLAFVLILWLCVGLKKLLPRLYGSYLPETVVMLAVSVAGMVFWKVGAFQSAYFVPVFCYFTLGALVCWGVIGKIPVQLVYVAIAAAAVTGLVAESRLMIVGSGTALMFSVLGLRGKLKTTWNWTWIQFLGGISYSLYLIHKPIGTMLVMRAGYKLTGSSMASGIAWAVVAAAVSIFAAWVMYRLVERPSQRWAASIPKVYKQTPSTPHLETDAQAAS